MAVNIIVSMMHGHTDRQTCSCSVLCGVESGRERSVEKIWLQIKRMKTVDFVSVEWPRSAIFLDDTHINRELYQMNAI